MKLTKGKLSKIRNKKNQSAKRFKKTGKGSKTKTFRKRRALNLHNASLKKYKGGQEAKSPENDSKVIEPTKPNEVQEVAPTTDVVGEPTNETVTPTTDVVGEPTNEVATPTTDIVGEPTNETVTPTTDVVGEPTNETVTPTTDVVGEPTPSTPDVEKLGENPENLPAPVPISEVGVEVSPLAKEEIVEEGLVSPDSNIVSENVSETGSEDVNSIKEEPVSEEKEIPAEPTQQQEPVGNDISIVVESLDKLAEYISDKIAKKLNLNLGGSSTELNNDSFNAVANANDTLVQS